MTTPVQPLDTFIQLLLDGDQHESAEEVRRLRSRGVTIEHIVSGGIEKAMESLDAKCTVEQFNLLEIMLCGRAVMGVMKELYPAGSAVPVPKGTVVIASPQGDVHDLGKNIVSTIFSACGYRIIDTGKDCPLESIVEAAVREKADAVGLSGLITTVIPQVRHLRVRLTEAGAGHIRIMAGGAALKQSTPASLNVDFVADSVFDGLHYLDRVTHERH
jgi:methylmalonyl-CoA mutase cobalamin-binding domain/chain